MQAEYNYIFFFSQTTAAITIILLYYVNRGGGAGGDHWKVDGRLHRVCTLLRYKAAMV